MYSRYNHLFMLFFKWTTFINRWRQYLFWTVCHRRWMSSTSWTLLCWWLGSTFTVHRWHWSTPRTRTYRWWRAVAFAERRSGSEPTLFWGCRSWLLFSNSIVFLIAIAANTDRESPWICFHSFSSSKGYFPSSLKSYKKKRVKFENLNPPKGGHSFY